ncbi:MAG: single-stranded-DNA-specific exonuclease RecJ, partial [Chloroflexota bacterium]|nr:single-stranded-DNA-specific exonuclease RecJ [Chloroflexota bacterium]
RAIPGVTALQAQILQDRGVEGKDAALALLATDWRVTRALPGQAAAIARLRAALAGGERIIVYGDHDCDGVTSCATLLLALRALDANAGAYIPRREDDGRGLNTESVRQLAAQGTRLIVTTDCGSANVAEVALARELGMDVIITDHHPIHGETPRDCVLVNPRLDAERGPHDDLAGTGVAFRLAVALLRELAPERAEDEATRLLDLVAIGTVGDIVPMTRENWALVRAGLERLRSAPRPGLRALLARAEVRLPALGERDITYVIAPRINAAARLGEPTMALDLLLARTEAEGDALASSLDALNQERQRLTEEIMVEAERQVAEQVAGEDANAPLVSAVGEGWPLGMLGLVASRLAERNQRAAVVISRDGEEARGSARGPDGIDLGAALAERKEVFRRFGGHARAAGFTLASADVAALLDHLRERLAAQRRAAPAEAAAITVDCRLPLNRLIPRIYREQQALAPFGQKFGEPVYLCQGARVTSCWRSGVEGRNLRLRVRDATGEGVFFWARQGDLCDLFRARMGQTPPLDIAFSLDAFTRANGELDLLPRILSMRPLE